MTLIAFCLSASETGVPVWMLALAVLCDTLMISIAIICGYISHPHL